MREIQLIGHEDARQRLEKELPQVTLLLGPASVGKFLLAKHLAEFRNMGWYFVNSLTASEARSVVDYAHVRRYVNGEVFGIRLDGSTETAQNILLKILEEPPDNARFILTASRHPLPTIVSRSVVVRIGMLSDQEVAEILVKRHGIEPTRAAALAPHGRGQVAPALSKASEADGARVRSMVGVVIKAAKDGISGTTVDAALRTWDITHTTVLRTWAAEAASGRWTYFTPDFVPGTTPVQARRVLETLTSYSESRNAVAVALDNAFGRNKNA